MTSSSSSPNAPAALLSPEELQPAADCCRSLLAELDRILLGRTELHRLVLAGILSRGHVLLEGLPGLGKTALVKALGQLLGLHCARVQFTPDLMPSDILGAHILQQTDTGRELRFQKGPIFTNLLLADEINRASPKTQSALLEAMQESAVTLMGRTHPLPEPFFVLASQNPIELEGTYPLPEAQLDRFLFKLNVRGVRAEVLEEIISTRRRGRPPESEFHLSTEQLTMLYDVMGRIFLPRAVGRYIARLVEATHPDSPSAPDCVRDFVTYGASPRAAIALAEASRGMALLQGRPTVGFEDVRAVVEAVLNHRILLNYKARLEQRTTTGVVEELLTAVEEVPTGLPGGMDLRVEAGHES
jgi:MoxR-like ATPase